jgi:glycerol-3-phosphate O-acyltransferase
MTPAALTAVALGGLAIGLLLAWRQAWGWRGMLAVRRRFPARIERYKHAGKPRIRAALLADPEVAAAVSAHAAETGDSAEAAWAKVRVYVDEIVPSFNLLAYYRLGYGVARLLLPLLYKVSVGYEPRAALNAIPRDSVVVYLMNHRSNADYVLVAYVLSGRVAVSYAVGEWARVWPLETLFKSFGSYFVRRRYREALYHKVLERYVQLITRNGVTQGVFIEGGLTRDGSFRPPKLGLLDYLAGVKRDPAFVRPIFFVPVAINYDRVLEDRSLLREVQPRSASGAAVQAPEERLRRRDQLVEVASYLLKVSARFLLRRARRYGRACVNFGEPISLDEWLSRHPGVLELPREERLARLSGLAQEVMARIGAVMPVTAVAMACTALLQDRCESISRQGWEARLGDLGSKLRQSEAHLVGGDRKSAEVLDRALVMLTLRHVVTPQAGEFRVDRAQEPLMRYYASSIAHLLPGAAPAAR